MSAQVCLKKQNIIERKTAADKFFCVHREWNQKAEDWTGKFIEDPFASLVSAVLSQSVKCLSIDDHRLVTDMYSLWHTRQDFRINSIPDQPIQGGLRPQISLTIDDQEKLEKHGVTSVGQDMKISGRDLSGLMIRRRVDDFYEQHGRFYHWVITQSTDGKFLVPDYFWPTVVLPISPSTALIERNQLKQMHSNCLTKTVNSLAIKSSMEYFFGMDLNDCPTLA